MAPKLNINNKMNNRTRAIPRDNDTSEIILICILTPVFVSLFFLMLSFCYHECIKSYHYKTSITPMRS